ncbi:MAG: energy transducer TonB [Candidatus Acidiferrales bacterium]
MNDFAEAMGIASGPAGLESADPLPMEVPVRVRGFGGDGNLGADTVFEPFLEDTQTVLVSQHGAVLRLAAHAAPGQILSISSPRLGRELVARVIRYRAHDNVKGYAEIEFTGTDAAAKPPPAPARTSRPPKPVAAAPVAKANPANQSSTPLVVAPLADLQERPRAARVSLNQLDPAVEPASARKPAPKPQPQAPAAARRPRPAPVVADIEKLLAARKPAQETRAPALGQDFALRMFDSQEGVPSSPAQRPRRRWLAVAAVITLAVGAAGTWGVVSATNEAAMEPLPHIPALALPKPPEAMARRAEVAAAEAVATVPAPGLGIETPSAVVIEELPKVPDLELAAPRANRSAPQREIAPPEPGTMSAAPIGATQPGALQAFVGKPAAPPEAPKPAPLIGGKVTPPRLLEQAPVVYPQMARMTRLEGNVVIDARIDETGRVTEMRVVSGPTLLHQAAKDSLARWRYEPGTLNGKPVTTNLVVTIQFRR